MGRTDASAGIGAGWRSEFQCSPRLVADGHRRAALDWRRAPVGRDGRHERRLPRRRDGAARHAARGGADGAGRPCRPARRVHPGADALDRGPGHRWAGSDPRRPVARGNGRRVGRGAGRGSSAHRRAGGAIRRLRTDAGGQSPTGDADPVGRDRSQPHRLRARMVGRPRRGDRRSHARRAVGDAPDVERAGPPPPRGTLRPPAAGDPDGEGIRHRRVRDGRATGLPPDRAAPRCGDRDLRERRRRPRPLLDPQ